MNSLEVNKLLARTINVGLDLGEQGADKWCIRPDDITWKNIRDANFTAVRLCITWVDHCEKQTPFTIDPSVFTQVDAAVKGAVKHGLAVVVSNFLDPELMKDPVKWKARFLSISRQVAEHYETAPESVVIELLAEPREKMDAVWNDYLAAGLAEIRTSNPTRTIVIGPASYNNARKLSQLQLPEDDRNIIVTIHHYWPLKFTIQGETFYYEEWAKMPLPMKLFLGNPRKWPGTTWKGTPRQKAILKSMFDKAESWAKAHDRPLFVGEFGTSNTADMTSRVRWAHYITTLCRERSMSWGYWSYGPAFALYDATKKQWHTELLDALK
ncbi:MAG: glycoside hydrolase family 5 protein [Micrococcaceae bacterium]